MDLSLRKTSSTWVRIFQKGDFWELQKEILNGKFRPLWTEIGFFFLPRFRSTKQLQAAEAFFLAYRLIKSSRPRVTHSFNHNSYSFFQSNQTIQAFLRIISRNYEFRKFWSVDYSFIYFLSHSISSAKQVVMQISELTIRGYFGPCSHVTETQGFFQQKNWKASENVQKSEITHW